MEILQKGAGGLTIAGVGTLKTERRKKKNRPSHARRLRSGMKKENGKGKF